jgi:archaellum component FlaC
MKSNMDPQLESTSESESKSDSESDEDTEREEKENKRNENFQTKINDMNEMITSFKTSLSTVGDEQENIFKMIGNIDKKLSEISMKLSSSK